MNHQYLEEIAASEQLLPNDKQTYNNIPPKRKHYTHLCTPLVLHILLICVYTSTFFLFRRLDNIKLVGKKPGLNAYSPVLEAISWEPRTFHAQLTDTNPFKGPPRDELDDAWNNLLGPMTVKVDKEVLDKMNRTSTELADGSGYMVTIDVYHQLHCLKYLRKYIHPEYYNLTGDLSLKQHIDHCLDGLRQYLMCNADVVLLTFDWIPNYFKPWPNFEVKHECANWESIENWAWEHTFDQSDPNLLKHPDFHPELPGPFAHVTNERSR